MNKFNFLVDSHCHLHLMDLTKYDNDLSKVLVEIRNCGVQYLLNVSTTLVDIHDLIDIANKSDNIVTSIGLHPLEEPEKALNEEWLLEHAKHKKVVAIGETGLDFSRNFSNLQWQKHRFAQHINCANSLQKPLIIHTRDAAIDTIDIMRNENAQQCGGVMHCFTETISMAKQALDLGFYISISGIVTFKNAAQIQEVAQYVPLDRLLIETDSPYLAPIPYRGKQNHPGLVKYVAEKIAILRNISTENVVENTCKNFFDLFKDAKC